MGAVGGKNHRKECFSLVWKFFFVHLFKLLGGISNHGNHTNKCIFRNPQQASHYFDLLRCYTHTHTHSIKKEPTDMTHIIQFLPGPAVLNKIFIGLNVAQQVFLDASSRPRTKAKPWFLPDFARPFPEGLICKAGVLSSIYCGTMRSSKPQTTAIIRTTQKQPQDTETHPLFPVSSNCSSRGNSPKRAMSTGAWLLLLLRAAFAANNSSMVRNESLGLELPDSTAGSHPAGLFLRFEWA